MPEAQARRSFTQGGALDTVELLRRVKASDSGAFDGLLARHLPWLHLCARRRLPPWTRNAVDTEDLVQETVLHTLQHVRRFEPRDGGTLRGYLRRSLRNLINDQYRSAARRPGMSRLEEDRADSTQSPLDLAIAREDEERYRRALARLRASDRRALIARLELGYTYQELAPALLKPTPGAACVAIYGAVLRLGHHVRHASRRPDRVDEPPLVKGLVAADSLRAGPQRCHLHDRGLAFGGAAAHHCRHFHDQAVPILHQ